MYQICTPVEVVWKSIEDVRCVIRLSLSQWQPGAVTTKQESALIGSAPLCSQPAQCDSGDTDITMVTKSTGGWGGPAHCQGGRPLCHGWGASPLWSPSACYHVSAGSPSPHPVIVQPSKSIIHVNYPKTKLFHPSRPDFTETHSLPSKNDAMEY